MIKNKTQKKKVDQIIEILKICDKCGKEISSSKRGDIYEFQEFTHIDFVGGYGSIFGDGIRVKCDLCQNCLLELIKDYYRISE